eukprot:SAG31_NODE_589_length_13808_cov_3.896710_10_plen_107_part_00
MFILSLAAALWPLETGFGKVNCCVRVETLDFARDHICTSRFMRHLTTVHQPCRGNSMGVEASKLLQVAGTQQKVPSMRHQSAVCVSHLQKEHHKGRMSYQYIELNL